MDMELAIALKEITDLEKENARLTTNEKSLLAERKIIVKENTELKAELTKAKALLAKWVELFKPKLEGYPITPIQEQTEQFLKEEANENYKG